MSVSMAQFCDSMSEQLVKLGSEITFLRGVCAELQKQNSELAGQNGQLKKKLDSFESDKNEPETRRHETPDRDFEEAWAFEKSTSVLASDRISRNGPYDEAYKGNGGRTIPPTEGILPVRGDGVRATDVESELPQSGEEIERRLPEEPETIIGTKTRRPDNGDRNEGRMVHRKDTF